MFGLFGGGAERISGVDAVSQVKKGKMVVLDVRDAVEVAQTGKAQGAVHIPMMLLNMQADPSSPECNKKLSVDKPVAIYCATGARSGMAARQLKKMGYQSVYNLGGLGNWAGAGGKIER
ncbi:MAG: sulfurtransferase [Rhodobacterales bacterium]|nr:MAG: sulfurtransferase [Rhodobacterales bacterium]